MISLLFEQNISTTNNVYKRDFKYIQKQKKQTEIQELNRDDET